MELMGGGGTGIKARRAGLQVRVFFTQKQGVLIDGVDYTFPCSRHHSDIVVAAVGRMKRQQFKVCTSRCCIVPDDIIEDPEDTTTRRTVNSYPASGDRDAAGGDSSRTPAEPDPLISTVAPCKSVKLLRAIILAWADVDVVGMGNCTLLHLARYYKNAEIERGLITAGPADGSYLKNGKTLCTQGGNPCTYTDSFWEHHCC